MDKGGYCITHCYIIASMIRFSFSPPPIFLINFILFCFGVEGEMGDIGMCDVKDAENKKMEITGIHIENLGIM